MVSYIFNFYCLLDSVLAWEPLQKVEIWGQAGLVKEEGFLKKMQTYGQRLTFHYSCFLWHSGKWSIPAYFPCLYGTLARHKYSFFCASLHINWVVLDGFLLFGLHIYLYLVIVRKILVLSMWQLYHSFVCFYKRIKQLIICLYLIWFIFYPCNFEKDI